MNTLMTGRDGAGQMAMLATTSAASFREGMRRLAAAVNVVTTDGPNGRHGFTATAVCSVTDNPPTLLVCLNRRSGSFTIYRKNTRLCVNVLGPTQAIIAHVFAAPAPVEKRYATGVWTELETGAPVLVGAVASFDCVLDRVIEAGTHDVFFCRVVAVRLGERADGLIWFEGSMHDVGKSSVLTPRTNT